MSHGGARNGAGRKKGAATKITEKAREAAAEGGIMPLDYMLDILRNEELTRDERMDAAKAAAPYLHAKLVSTQNKTEITTKNVVALPDRAKTTEEWQSGVNTHH
jgi:hypothetical protein